MKWFRMHHGASSHKKWLLIARKSGQPVPVVGMVAWALMEKASKSTPRGSVEGFKADEFAAYLDVEEDAVEAILKAFEEKEWIKNQILTSWEENNPKSDYSTERVRKHRKRKKAVTETDETVTGTKRNKSNGLDKIREDNKKKIIKEKFNEFWEKSIRKDSGRTFTEKKFITACKKEDPDVILKAWGDWIDYWEEQGTEKKFIPMASTWLNRESWNAEIPESDYQKTLNALGSA